MKCDADSKFITNYAVTDAALHDSNRCIDFLDEKDEALYVLMSKPKIMVTLYLLADFIL